jgi:phospholipid/cholesterol/gamma-HCH transport system substrate-binding protein
MNEQALRFRVGIFVLGTMVLLAGLTFLFSGFPTLLKSHRQYTILFRDAAGVAPGTPVRRSGVNIGEVKSVELDDTNGHVRVIAVIDARHPLRRGDQPTLVRGMLGGDVSIDFVPLPEGRPPGEPLEPGSELVGAQQSDALTLLNQTSESVQRYGQMAPEVRRTNEEIQVAARNWSRLGERMDVLLQTNQDKLVQAVDNLNDTLNRISRVFNEENQRNLSTTLKNARAGSENLESISRNTDELLKESRKTVERINSSVTQTDEVLRNLQQATKPMADRSNAVMKNLDESTEKLNRTLTDTRELVRAVSQSDGTLHRLVADPALYNNLTDASCMLVRILPRLDRILHDMEVFSDKIARHPESLGLGGVVSPSSGLKEAPSSWHH